MSYFVVINISSENIKLKQASYRWKTNKTRTQNAFQRTLESKQRPQFIRTSDWHLKYPASAKTLASSETFWYLTKKLDRMVLEEKLVCPSLGTLVAGFVLLHFHMREGITEVIRTILYIYLISILYSLFYIYIIQWCLFVI